MWKGPNKVLFSWLDFSNQEVDQGDRSIYIALVQQVPKRLDLRGDTIETIILELWMDFNVIDKLIGKKFKLDLMYDLICIKCVDVET